MWVFCLLISTPAVAQGTRRDTTTYRRMKAALDAIPAIDTHDHLLPFDRSFAVRETRARQGGEPRRTLAEQLLHVDHPLEPWTPGMAFDAWWQKAKHDFDDARATSFYRYQLPAFADLYGVDFDRITDAQARQLDDRIFANYKDSLDR